MHPKHNKIHCVSLSVSPGVDLFHTGPPLDLGPLPSFFYFALSGSDSLCLDPFNQPVQFLQGKGIRIFSMTLPAHEPPFSPQEALKIWAQEYQEQKDPLTDFLEMAQQAIEYTVKSGIADPNKMGIGGLSRGGFIAFHLAARDERLKYLVAFAPLTQLPKAQEFAPLSHLRAIQNLSLDKIIPQICQKHIRIYIGNADRRVGTQECFDFSLNLVEKALEQKIRIPQIEFFMKPSIGFMGHGTALETFSDGALWMEKCLT